MQLLSFAAFRLYNNILCAEMLKDQCLKNDDRSNPSTISSVHRQITQLRRLLHCIEQTNSDTDVDILHLSTRMDFARQLFREIQDEIILSFHDGEDDATVAALMNDLQSSIQHTCTMTYLEISRRQSLRVINHMDETNSPLLLLQSDTNVVHDIFFSNIPSKHVEPQGKLDGREDSEGGDAVNNMKLSSEDEYKESTDYQPEAVLLEPLHSSRAPKKKTNNTSNEEVLTSGETEIEEEIAEMAQQLKMSTLSVNETL